MTALTRTPSYLNEERALSMATLYKSGATLQKIGEFYGITRERVRQILSNLGISGGDGGIAKVTRDKLAMRLEAKEKRCLAKHGCNLDQYRMLQRLTSRSRTRYTGPIGAYKEHQRNALMRGISWELTLWQWWEIWRDSGKWDERGRGAEGYCMARRNDVGPYSEDNVYICTQSQNMRDYYSGKFLLKKARSLRLTKREGVNVAQIPLGAV